MSSSVKQNNQNLSQAEIAKREEEDLAKAIQLSLSEANKSNKTQTKSNGSLYGNLANASSNLNEREPVNRSKLNTNRSKVKALYDFEAAEDNEITFKAGEILFITDDSDRNWWKGHNMNGDEGLFPSNFVTNDLSLEIENFEPKNTTSNKKVTFKDKISVKLMENNSNSTEVYAKNSQIIIDERKIDECAELLQNADPTGEIQSDSAEMLDLEEQCYLMGPLIDQQLQRIDYKHAILEELNLKILESFQMYNSLMKESLNKNIFASSTNPIITNHQTPNLNAVNTSSINSIPFVTAPPSNENSALTLANQLSNFSLSSSSSTNFTSNLSNGSNIINHSINSFTS